MMSAPHKHSDFIGELCVALAHKWEPQRLFVIFTAYFDESDTHGQSPTVILSANIGHAFQWRRFDSKLGKIREKYGFKIFHAKDFKARSREFSGWSSERQNELVDDLTELVKKTLTGGVTVFLEHSRYINEYRAPPIPKKMNLDSQLGVCFRACMGHLIRIMEKNGYHDRLNIVMERGHPNVLDCERILNELKESYKATGKDFIGTFTIATKDDCPPLMVSDLLGAAHSTLRAAISRGEIDSRQFFVSPDTKWAKLAFLELAPEALRGLKSGFEEFRQQKISHWREMKKKRAEGIDPENS
jgi:hypothetical protein